MTAGCLLPAPALSHSCGHLRSGKDKGHRRVMHGSHLLLLFPTKKGGLRGEGECSRVLGRGQ